MIKRNFAAEREDVEARLRQNEWLSRMLDVVENDTDVVTPSDSEKVELPYSHRAARQDRLWNAR